MAAWQRAQPDNDKRLRRQQEQAQRNPRSHDGSSGRLRAVSDPHSAPPQSILALQRSHAPPTPAASPPGTRWAWSNLP
jgi:hypothetical protein